MSDIIHIEWIDTAGYDAPWSSDTDLEPAKVQSTGFMVKETKKAITIGQSQDDNTPPQWDNLLVIPKRSIAKRTIIKRETI